MDLLRGLGGLLGGPGGFLGRLETNLRAKMAPRWIWEASWGGLGGFLGRLEAKLRAKMAPSWQEGGFGDPKTKRKRMQYRETLGVDIFMDFGSILGSKMEPSWHQIGIQHR